MLKYCERLSAADVKNATHAKSAVEGTGRPNAKLPLKVLQPSAERLDLDGGGKKKKELVPFNIHPSPTRSPSCRTRLDLPWGGVLGETDPLQPELTFYTVSVRGTGVGGGGPPLSQ